VPRRKLAKFLNVDLDLKSSGDLDPVLAQLGSSVILIHQGRVGRRHWVRLELVRQPLGPSDAINRFTGLADRLSGDAKRLFARAKKEFDVGVEASTGAQPGEWLLTKQSVQAAARHGGNIRLTVYPRLRARP
jgi:hypothetical protein